MDPVILVEVAVDLTILPYSLHPLFVPENSCINNLFEGRRNFLSIHTTKSSHISGTAVAFVNINGAFFLFLFVSFATGFSICDLIRKG